jgi:hypothetical protein
MKIMVEKWGGLWREFSCARVGIAWAYFCFVARGKLRLRGFVATRAIRYGELK